MAEAAAADHLTAIEGRELATGQFNSLTPFGFFLDAFASSYRTICMYICVCVSFLFFSRASAIFVIKKEKKEREKIYSQLLLLLRLLLKLQ